MFNFFKKRIGIIISVVITAILCISSTAYAVNRIHSRDVTFTSENSKFDANNVNDALDYLYENKSGEGYVGLLSGSYSISTAYGARQHLPILYWNTKYGYVSGNDIVFTVPGTYQIVATAAHSPINNTYTTFLYAYLNGTRILDNDNAYNVSATNDKLYYNILDTEITVKENDVFSTELATNGNISGITGGTVVIIKK